MIEDPDESLPDEQVYRRYLAARTAGRLDAALNWLDILIARHPRSGRLAFFKGRMLFSAGRYDEGEPWLTRGLQYHAAKHSKGHSGDRTEPGSKLQVPVNTAGQTPLCVVGMPRSASSNLTETLAKLTNRPSMALGFGEIVPNLNVFLQDSYLDQFVEGGFTSHSHLTPTRESLEKLAGKGIRKVLVQVREPRQALASFHKFSKQVVDMASRLNFVWAGYTYLSPQDQMTLLAKTYYPSLLSWLKGWETAREERWSGIEISIVKFEDMADHAPAYRDGLARFLEMPPEDIPSIIEADRRVPQKDEWRELLDHDQQAALDTSLRDLDSSLYSA